MDENAPHLTPELARAQLEHAASTRVGNDRDRWVHSIAMIAFGLLMGLNHILTDVVGNVVGSGVGTWGLAVVFALVWNWRSRALTVPRHTHVAVAVAFFTTLAVMFPGLDLMRITALEQPWESIVSGPVVAAPMLLAAIWIQIRR